MSSSTPTFIDRVPYAYKVKESIHMQVVTRGEAVLGLLPPNWSGEVRIESQDIETITRFVRHSRNLSEGLVLWSYLIDAAKQSQWAELDGICQLIRSEFPPFWKQLKKRDQHISPAQISRADDWLRRLIGEVSALWELTKQVHTMLQHEYDAAPFSMGNMPVGPTTSRSIRSDTTRRGSLGLFASPSMLSLKSAVSAFASTTAPMPSTPVSPAFAPDPSSNPSVQSPSRFLGSPKGFRDSVRGSVASATEAFRRVLSFGVSKPSKGSAQMIDGKLGADPAGKHLPTDSGVGLGSISMSSPSIAQASSPRSATQQLLEPFPDFARESTGSFYDTGAEAGFSTEEVRLFDMQRQHTLTPRQSSWSIRSSPGSPVTPVGNDGLAETSGRFSIRGGTTVTNDSRRPVPRKGSTYSLFPPSTPTSPRAGSSFSSPLASRSGSVSSSRTVVQRGGEGRRRR